MKKIFVWCAAFAPLLAGAATKTWSGGAGDFLWSSPGNWQGGTIPQNGDDVVISIADVSLNNDIAGLKLASLSIANSAVASLSGETITIQDELSVAAQAQFTFTCGLDFPQGGVFTKSTAREIVIRTKGVSGDGTLKFEGDKNSVVSLDAAGDFSGVWYVTGGRLNIWNVNALGTGSVEIHGANSVCNGQVNFCRSGTYANDFVLDASNLNALPYNKILATSQQNVSVVLTGKITTTTQTRISAENSGASITFSGDCVFGNNTLLNGIFNFKDVKSFSGRLYSDSGSINLYEAVPVSADCVLAKGTLNTYAENILPRDRKITLGVSYGRWETLNLRGFDQILGTLADCSGADQDAGRIVTSTAGAATLTVKNSGNTSLPIHVNGEASINMAGSGTIIFTSTSQTSGGLSAESGVLRVADGATFPNLSSLAVSGSGKVDWLSEAPDLLATVEISGNGTLSIGEGIVLTARMAKLNGEYLDPDDYTYGDGTLRVISKPAETGGVFTWTGANGTALSDAANWKEEKAPAFAGGDTLVFSEGTDNAIATADVDVGKIVIETNAVFNLAAAEGKKIHLRGGILATNTAESGTIAHAISAPIEVDAGIQQTWDVGLNTELAISGDITEGHESMPVVKQGKGRLVLSGNNTLASQIVVSNGSVRVKNSAAVPAGGFAVSAAPNTDGVSNSGRYLDFANGTVVDAPVDLYAQWSYVSETEGGAVTFEQPVTLHTANATANQFHIIRANGRIVFRGGIFADGNRYLWLNVHNTRCSTTFENTPLDFGSLQFNLDGAGYAYLNVAGNKWGVLNIYATDVHCGVENALCPTAGIVIGQPFAPTVHSGKLYLDGHYQTALYLASQSASDTVDCSAEAIRSDTAAQLILVPTASKTFCGKFEGMSGLTYRGGESTIFNLRQNASPTLGRLQVDSGTVRFDTNGGFNATTNIVLTGGTLAVAADSAGLGENAILRIAGGKLNLEDNAGQRIAKLYFDDKTKAAHAGTYGGTGSGAANIMPERFSGTGVLTVLHDDMKGTIVSLH